jgi:hypothetical protein
MLQLYNKIHNHPKINGGTEIPSIIPQKINLINSSFPVMIFLKVALAILLIDPTAADGIIRYYNHGE